MIFMAGGNAYSLVHEYKNGWNPEAFRERYSEVLERFDYVVGDWGYNQLRLRGFYRDGHPRAGKEFAISNFIDYINEYCNFGCAHFVLAKLDVNALPPDAVIVKEEAPEAAVALNETGGQAAETAAALSSAGGPIMRWPLKERAGGPVRVPNVTVSAVARAAADAERREAERRNAGQDRDQRFGGSSFSGRGSHARNGQESGGQRQGRSHGSSGSERRGQGQGSGQAPNKPHYRGGHKNHQDAQAPREGSRNDGAPRKDGQRHEGSRGDGPRGDGSRKEGQRNEGFRHEGGRNEGSRNENSRGEGARNDAGRSDGSRSEGARNEGGRDGRWQSRNRRRKSFGGKPGNRPEGSPRPESGASKSSE